MNEETRKALSRWRNGLYTQTDLMTLAASYSAQAYDEDDPLLPATDEDGNEIEAPKVYETITLHW